MSKYLLFTFCAFLYLTSFSQPLTFLKADGKKIVNIRNENILLRGIGLGGWMVQEGYMLHLQNEGQQYRIRQRIENIIGADRTKEFYAAWLSNHCSRSDIDSLHAWGFNSIRLPMHYNLFTLPAEAESATDKNTWLPVGFQMVDSLISWCRANRMYVFLDLHAAPGGQGNDLNISDRDPSKPSLWQSEANKQKTISLWRQLAARYAQDPVVGGYDILNEPNWGFADTLHDRNGLSEKGNAPLRQLLMDITKAIRSVDQNHIIIIEGNGWGNNYAGMLPTWDNNMVLSFHKYWNLNDLSSIQHILDYREKYQVPVWLGETGENSNTWFTEAIRLLESNNIGWAWWPLKKLGNNNPLQIRSNAVYDSLVKFWNGESSLKPNADDAYQALMALAANAKIERNIVHTDVIDAMIRQPFHGGSKPFKTNLIKPGSGLWAVDYDLGSIGVAYYDLDSANYRISTGKESTGNRGHTYRNDGVDIYPDSANPAEFYVGHIESGEWIQYTIQVAESGKYKLVFSVSAKDQEGMMTVSIKNAKSAAQIKKVFIPTTGSNEQWKNVSADGFNLKKGIYQIRLMMDHGGFNLKSIRFEK